MNGKIYIKSLGAGCLALALTLGTGLSAQQEVKLHEHDQQAASEAAKSDQVPEDVRKLVDDLHQAIRVERQGTGDHMKLIHHLMMMLHQAIGRVHGQHSVQEIHEAHKGQGKQEEHQLRLQHEHQLHMKKQEQHSQKHGESHSVHGQHPAKHEKHAAEEKQAKKVQVH